MAEGFITLDLINNLPVMLIKCFHKIPHKSRKDLFWSFLQEVVARVFGEMIQEIEKISSILIMIERFV